VAKAFRSVSRAYLPVQGICPYPLRLVAEHRGHPDVPRGQPRHLDHPGRNDDDGGQTDTVRPKTRFASRYGVIESLLILLSQFSKTATWLLRCFTYYRNAIRTRLIADGIIGQDAYVVIAGPANTYAHYVTTREEYGVQRYEGASTLFGPS
jgi:hypothetical protein